MHLAKSQTDTFFDFLTRKTNKFKSLKEVKSIKFKLLNKIDRLLLYRLEAGRDRLEWPQLWRFKSL